MLTRHLIILITASILAGATLCMGAEDDEFADYEQVDYKVITISPEAYKNDKVSYEGVYLGFSTTFPRYMEDSGISASRYVGIGVTNLKLPAILKKSKHEELVKELAQLAKGSTVRFYGKVRKFRRKPEATIHPHYYLELHHLEVIAAVAEEAADRRERNPKWRR